MDKKTKLLIVDDDKDVLLSSRVVLRECFDFIQTESNPFRIPAILLKEEFDVIMLDMNFSTDSNKGEEGIHWLKEILKINSEANVVLITAYGELELAVKAMRIGAIDFVSKPWENEKLVATLQSALKLSLSKNEVQLLKSKQNVLNNELNKASQEILYESECMRKVMENVKRSAPTNANILILGENGTGKELIAREIHSHSKRSDEIFIKLDVGAIPQSLFESELFGYKKGSFTDANIDRQGRIELASGGTLFIDEIGNIELRQQSKLLSVLENREVYRLGSNDAIPIDIRLISATNLPLNILLDENKFRKDLFYRMNTVLIELPPLRERKDDIPLLVNFYTMKYLKEYNKSEIRFSKRAINKLVNYHWPGNVRELKHIVARAIILCNSDVIDSLDINLNQELDRTSASSMKIEELEKNAIKKALKLNNGNLTNTAKSLGLGRTTLYRKMNKYDL